MSLILSKTQIDDDIMTFNKVVNRYELTLTYAKSLVGSPYADDNEMSRRISLNSLIVYSYIYNRGNSNNKRYTKVMLNNSNLGRLFLIDVLGSQLRADADNGYNDLSMQNGIDFSNGSVIDREEMRKNKVSVDTQDLIENSMADLNGYNLIYQGKYYIPVLDSFISENDL